VDPEPPGFTWYSEAERSAARAELAKLLIPPLERPFDLPYDDRIPPFTLDERLMRPILERGLAPAAVTMMFERAGCGFENYVVGWVQQIQGRFRPDLGGLFPRYWELATERGFERFLGAGDEGGPRAACWQIGWTISRRGLRGLVPGLAAHLSDADRTNRVAAAFLIADAADYVTEPRAPFFGGGFGPDRRTYEALPGLGELVPWDEYVCPRGDYRWPVLGRDDAPAECPTHHLRLVFVHAGSIDG
jgi:hypothetical protein